MNANHRTPPTSGRSPRRRPLFWFLVLLALATSLLASPGTGIVSAQETTDTASIDDGASATLEGVTIMNDSGTSCWFTVTRSTEPPGGTPIDWGEVPLQWHISSSDCSAPHVDLVFHYSDEDLWYVANEGELSAFRYVSAGVWADQCTGTCVDQDANTVSVSDVALLGNWTIAEASDAYPGPAAVTLRGSARGANSDESALVLGLSVLTGIGLILGWRLRNPNRASRR
jgi:hypothetical protein